MLSQLRFMIIICIGVTLSTKQDNIITFTPSTPLCIGEEVQMICFILPPISETFISATALISFNGSTPAILTTINDNTLVGIDTTRYTADITGLNISTDRPGVKLNISDYQATDGDIVFGCHGINSALIPSVAIITGSPQRLASPPSSPIVTLSEPNNNCTNILISWTTPDNDRDIIEYSVYRNNTFLITTTDNDYTDTNQLTINTVYEYSVTATSCAGDSTPGVNTVSIGGYSITNSSQLFLSYDNTTSILTIHLALLLVMTPPPLMLEFSLDLDYNHTQSDITHQFSNSTTFLLLSSITNYSTYITPHNFTTDDGVVTNITACIQIIQQCGVFNGQTICRFFNSENPLIPPANPTTATNVSATTQILPTVADSPVSLLPAVVILIVIILIILIISISVITAMSIVIVIMYRKIQSIKSTDKPTEPAHLYQYIDMDKLTPGSTPRQEDPYYTPMSPTGTQSRPQDTSTSHQYSNLK